MTQKRIMGVLLVFTLTLVSIFGNLSAQADAASKIRLNKQSLTMAKGEKYRLRVKSLPQNAKVAWKSSNKRKATVSRKG